MGTPGKNFRNPPKKWVFPNYGYADPPLTFDQPFMDDGECAV